MDGFNLDTSGGVFNVPDAGIAGEVWWPDLSPFAQGYVEAMLEGAADDLADERMALNPWDDARLSIGFSDLAPETLALILRDCEARYAELVPAMRRQRRNGREFYEQRQRGTWPERFPPPTPYLGEDGKVYLREAAR